MAALPGALGNRYTRPIADLLPCACERIEKRRLATIGVAGEGDGRTHVVLICAVGACVVGPCFVERCSEVAGVVAICGEVAGVVALCVVVTNVKSKAASSRFRSAKCVPFTSISIGSPRGAMR